MYSLVKETAVGTICTNHTCTWMFVLYVSFLFLEIEKHRGKVCADFCRKNRFDLPCACVRVCVCCLHPDLTFILFRIMKIKNLFTGQSEPDI